MPPNTRTSSRNATVKEEKADSSSTKPKYFPLFNKKELNPATTNEDSKLQPQGLLRDEELQKLDDVSSPPPEDTGPPGDVPQPNEPSQLFSIFHLPVPKLKAKSSTSSLRSAKSSNKLYAAASSSKPVVPKEDPTAVVIDSDTVAPVRSSKPARTKRPALVIHLSEDEETPVLAGPSTKAIVAPPDSPIRTPVVVQGPTKAAHPFFAPRKKEAPNAISMIIVEDDDPASGSRVDPIRIPSLDPPGHPVSIPSSSATPAWIPSHKKVKTVASDPPWPSRETQHVRGPQETFTNPASFQHTQRPFVLTDATYLRPENSLLDVLPLPSSAITPSHASPVAADEVPFSVPKEHSAQPAFTAVLKSIVNPERPTHPLRERWADHWRPRRAKQVLGNEAHAQYLKAWLQTLELGTETVVTSVAEGGSKTLPESEPARKGNGKVKEESRGVKRQIVTRKVEKAQPKKRRKTSGYGNDDWIASDDSASETEEDDVHDEEEESEPLHFRPSVSPRKENRSTSRRSSTSRSSSPSSERFSAHQFAPLTNSILLSGPSGSGKTAAVYACADELGWEVYEVYPGMGKRSGANLSAIVEGVSKNHVLGGLAAVPEVSSTDPSQPPNGKPVRSKQSGKKPANAKSNLLEIFSKQTLRRTASSRSVGSVEEPIVLDDSHSTEDPLAAWDFPMESPKKESELPHTSSRADVPQIRQSLILLEEVDILYAEDKSFWPAVVDLIAASRRPVVMTCNDVTVIPLDELPLQTTLYFESPSKPIMSAYLRCLVQANGHAVSDGTIDRVVEGSRYIPISADLLDQPLLPVPHQEVHRTDLRQAINQLQLLSRIPPSTGHVPLTKAPEHCKEDQERLCDWTDGFQASERGEGQEQSSAEALAKIWAFMEVVSTTDAYVDRRPAAALDAFSMDRYSSTPDDELGHRNLEKSDSSYTEAGTGVAFYVRDEAMAVESLQMAQGCLRGQGDEALARGETCPSEGKMLALRGVNLSSISFDSRRLYLARAHHQRQLVEFIDDVVQTVDVPLLPRPAMVLDYVPYIQWMVEIDDVQAEVAKSLIGVSEGSIVGNGRRGAVRQSSRIGARVPTTHERYISLSEEGLHAARGSRLVV